jgi:hypothetical protein
VEVYVLDSLLRRTAVFDKFESLIWTERFAEVGDFELDLTSTLANRRAFLHGTQIAINESLRVMKVETVEDATDADGKAILKVKGYSIEDVLRHRVAKYSMLNTTDEPTWDILAPPADIARTMFDHICRDGALDLADKIPFLQTGSIYPASTLPEPNTVISWNQSPDALYNAIKNVLDPYELGFRLVRDFDSSRLYFDIYAGNDRTSRQTVLAPVIFSENLENIQNTTELTTIADSKNVAYVFSSVGVKVVIAENVDPDVDGFERRVLVVNASDITADDFDIDGSLYQRGIEELNKNRGQALFDGEVNQYSQYKYGQDYDLGDLVEMRNKDGKVSYKRVTEQIFVSDDNGDRSYPTLYADIFAGENDWLSYNNKSTVWLDYDSDLTTTWKSLP